jgi:Tannase and feruloyl esterase
MRSLTTAAVIAAFVLLLAVGESGAKELPIVKAATACEALTNTVVAAPGEAPARILSAAIVSSGTPSPYCSVRGYVAPQVNFELHLPVENWTQRLLFSGCGGFCGAVNIRTQAADQCQPVQNGELALVSSDLGHASPVGGDAIWATDNPQGRIDFGYRGVHVVTVAAKQIIARYYGQRQRYAYFSGCSDGGREGMMEAQRYPEDFNGIITGASVINATANNSLYHAWIVQHLLQPDGSKVFADQELALLHDVVVKACALTGEQPGAVIADPRNCHFDPAALACRDTQTGCLSAKQLDSVRELYRGPHDASGAALYFGLPPGSELSWNSQAQGSRLFASSFIAYLAGDPSQPAVDLWSVAFTKASLQFYARSGNVLNALNPDLLPFQKSGGKLLMWHGWADASVPPMSSIAYLDAVRARLGAPASSELLRLYMLPGVYHCGGGLGPDKFDLLTPLMSWVEDGQPPGNLSVSTRVYGRTLRLGSVAPE